MKSIRPAVWTWVVLWITPVLPAADSARCGYAKSNNFTVLTPQQATAQEAHEYAEDILRSAELLRREIARQWLGEELPQSEGRTIVNVSFEPLRDAGLTWAIDDPRRQYHALYLSTSPELALGSTLAHELVHVVLATRFPHPHRLPAWLEEGIASRYDDSARQQQRLQIVKTCIRSGRWPPIINVLTAKNIPTDDVQAYTVAASITSLLLERDGDRQKLFSFGHYGNKQGWDAALRKYYGIPNVDQLQRIWQQSVVN